jgi:hypothetical protein
MALPPGYTDRSGEPGSLALNARVVVDLARLLRDLEGR